MLADYRSEKEGMTIAGSGASELGKLMREQHGKSGPVPHASRRLTQDIHQMPDNLARALAALPASLERQE